MSQLAFAGMGISLDEKITHSINLLREYEQAALKMSPGGYFLAFSGGKDSIVIKQLAIESGVKFNPHYSNTTIDPPELVHFIRNHHRDVTWLNPKVPFFIRMKSKGLPSRLIRWCCEEYKERGGDGLVKAIGVRAAESARRAKVWKDVTEWRSQAGGLVVAPILHWSDEDVWSFIRDRKLPYCSLYDEGWERLGCIGCPIAGKKRWIEFQRWPRYEKLWRWGCKQYFDSHAQQLNKKGNLYYVSRFESADEMFSWWMSDNPGPEMRHECLGLFSEGDLSEAMIETENEEKARAKK